MTTAKTNVKNNMNKQREKGWGIQYFEWPILVFIRFIRKKHEYISLFDVVWSVFTVVILT